MLIVGGVNQWWLKNECMGVDDVLVIDGDGVSCDGGDGCQLG